MNFVCRTRLILILVALTIVSAGAASASDLASALDRAGENRGELEAAIAAVPEGERDGMRWLITHMPIGDLTSLTAEYLVENHKVAYESWQSAPWYDAVDEAVFLDAVLPYASVNERRDAWRADLRERCLPLVVGAQSPGEAAVLLNNVIWDELGVKYSTEREKPEQSPFETMESGLASCSGLSVLLIDACRAVGVPARFVGTPLWSDDSGNHSWIEVWDDGWHFTGAAEPTGTDLDQGWFAGRAAGARRDVPQYAIYAVSWRDTPISFPLVWLPEDDSVNAVNVTDRYTREVTPMPAGECRVWVQVIDGATGERCAAQVNVVDANDGQVFEGTANDESFDANDHLEAHLREGATYTATATFGDRNVARVFQASEEGLQTLTLPGAASTGPAGEPPLTAGAVTAAQKTLWSDYVTRARADHHDEFESGVLTAGDLNLPFWYTTFGDKPAAGRSLYISMHGGGGAPKDLNDKQWENQKKLYTVPEGIYLAPRAATDTWNLWHQEHIDGFFDRLIQDLIVLEDVDPDRVYLNGYSAGGDGVFQLAPRMADRFAAAAMMAGHPNETQPDGLRNLPFALHMGADDAAYDRNQVARDWQKQLGEMEAADPGGYEHQVQIHTGKGHWMDGEDAVALTWMAEHTRNLRPERIVWLQDDVTHHRFYWLLNPNPQARERVVVERDGQTITIIEATPGTTLAIRLDDTMCDLALPVVVRYGEAELFRGLAPRNSTTMARTLAERGDPRGVFCAEVVVTVPQP